MKMPCRYYQCEMESRACRVMRKHRRLFCRECPLVGPPEGPPPLEVPNLGLGSWPSEKEEIMPKSEITQRPADENIGQAINRLRRDKGLSIAALARAIGVSSFSVQRWEKGAGEPHFQSARALDDYFGSDLAARFGACLRGAATGCSISAAAKPVEHPAAPPLENTELDECSNPAEAVEAEQAESAAETGGHDPERARQLNLALDIMSRTAEAVHQLAQSLGPVIKALREENQGGEGSR